MAQPNQENLAGPSFQKPSTVQSSKPPPRSFSLTARLRGKEPPLDLKEPSSPMSPRSFASLSQEQSLAADKQRSGSNSPLLLHDESQTPPDADPAADPLFKAARAKMSSRDQEAMRRIRNTMGPLSDSGSSQGPSASTTPNSPMFPPGPASVPLPAPTPREGLSRRSTYSKLLATEEGKDGMSVDPGVSRRASVSTHLSKSHAVEDAEDAEEAVLYVVAVIGQEGVGKTSLINRSLKQWNVSEPTTAKLPSGHTVHSYQTTIQPTGKITLPATCHFVEMTLSALTMDRAEDADIFPEGVPRMNGAVLCYEATARETLEGVPEVLDRLSDINLPTVLFACKTDPNASIEVEPAYANSLSEPYNVGLIEVSDVSNDGRSKMRNGMRWLMYKLEQRLLRERRKASQESIPSHRARPQSIDSDGTSLHQLIWHAEEGDRSGPITRRQSSSTEGHSPSLSSSVHWITQAAINEKAAAEKAEREAALETGDIEAVDTGQVVQKKDVSEAQIYVSLEELQNMLFTKIVAGDDESFVQSYLLTYRRFSSPSRLMAQFSERLREAETYESSQDVRHWALQRLTSALIKWVTEYPGDLADEDTQSIFHDIMVVVLRHPFMAHIVAELQDFEEQLSQVKDVDISWSLRPGAVVDSPDTTQTELLIDGETFYDIESLRSKSDLDSASMTKETNTTSSMRTTPSVKSLVGSDDLGRQRSVSDSRLASSRAPNPYGSEASQLVKELGVLHGRWSGASAYILTVHPRDFAVELTRLQWKLFTAIRPRDLFRHDFGKEKDGPVGKAIDFFNHVSRWTSTLILSEPKAKHRVRLYERLMIIAHQLRRLNNYDSLYAMISGMRETSILRLTQTHAMLQPAPQVNKDFMSHTKLMDPRGGYVHYRRALDADVSHGRPAIPLLTVTLGLVSRMQAARPEDIRPSDGFVQWDKFARFGEMLAVISECQSRGSMVQGQASSTFETFLNETPILKDEDALYDRSKLLEPGSGQVGQSGIKVFKRFGKLGL